MSDFYKFDGSVPYHRSSCDTSATGAFEDRAEAQEAMDKNLARINQLQQMLYAEKKEGVIFLFQAMDAAGKDGTIRAVLSCLSPQGVTESDFKAPSKTELAHDFLWRVQRCTPEKGQIAIFNRSHYEDVLIGKVHKLYRGQRQADRIDPDKILEHRYEDICNWEKYLYHNSIRVVKIFLNVGREEQARRFLSRIREEKKNWKFSADDVRERAFWDEYQTAFEDAVNKTATKVCPWYVVPADHKWYMRWAVSEIIRRTLEEMAPHWPEATEEERAEFARFEAQLAAEAGEPPLAEPSPKKEKKAKKHKKGKKREVGQDIETDGAPTEEAVTAEGEPGSEPAAVGSEPAEPSPAPHETADTAE